MVYAVVSVHPARRHVPIMFFYAVPNHVTNRIARFENPLDGFMIFTVNKNAAFAKKLSGPIFPVKA